MTRLSDIILSIFAIVVLIPFFVPIAILLSCTGEGKVFYRQERIGKGKKRFKLLKFATMLEDSPNLPGGDITSGNDPRVLPVGKFLRKTKLNELPQLINILQGELSIIGPRPLTPKNFEIYNQDIQITISKVVPGLSGIGSIVFRDEESVIASSQKNTVDFYKNEISPYKGLLECWFVKHKSFFLYLFLIFVTAWVVFFPKSKIHWKIFPKLPSPPKSLVKSLNYL
jgi:lipopolysaccharide/colanic/teichoic acid biosynthesis glycosyltransferase